MTPVTWRTADAPLHERRRAQHAASGTSCKYRRYAKCGNLPEGVEVISSLFGRQINLPSELLWHGPCPYSIVFRRFVPFSLLQALLVARSCCCHSLHLPSFSLFFQELSLFIRFCKLSLPTVVYPLEQATIIQASSPVLYKLDFAAPRLLLDLDLPVLEKRRCTYIGHSNQICLR
jgi:hypothetical protein